MAASDNRSCGFTSTTPRAAQAKPMEIHSTDVGGRSRGRLVPGPGFDISTLPASASRPTMGVSLAEESNRAEATAIARGLGGMEPGDA